MKSKSRKPVLRCAVYTRVSTEHGLKQEFNSLDNQREASEASAAQSKVPLLSPARRSGTTSLQLRSATT